MEAVIFTPKLSAPSQLQRRRITPSPEKSAPVKTTFISPKKRRPSSTLSTASITPTKRLFSHNLEAQIGKSFAQTSLAAIPNVFSEAEFELPQNAIPTPFTETYTKLAEAICTSRHVVFDFTLVENGMPRSPRTQDEWTVLENLFPTQYSIGVHGLFLIVRVRKLPPKPWPLSVAGLPFYITTNEWDYPWVRGEFGRGPKVLEHLDARHNVTQEIFDAATSYYDTQTDIKITAIRWSIGSWRVTVPDGIILSSLPRLLAHTPCSYVFDSEVLQPVEAAYRLKEPSAIIRDDSAYTDLRPGIMLSSARFEGTASIPARGELLTTSGVLVKDGEGNQYVTVASHGFALGEETVYHPNPNGVAIADVERRLSYTDIALARLKSSFTYRNETFENSTTSTSTALSRIRSPFELQYPEFLYMDNPFTGFAEGQWVATERRRVPSDEDVPVFNWVRHDWMWMGQGLVDAPTAGSCGSPVWDADGNLVLFFRFLIANGPESGLAIGVAAAELQKFGFELV